MPITNADISSLCVTLPEFTAGQNLSTFIKSVDNLLIFLQQQNTTAPQEFIINAHILSRIKGEPRDYLNYSNKTNWTDVRPALLTKYGDRRSEEILVTQLTTTVQKASESYDDYHHRIIDNLNDLLQHISLHNTPENLNFKTPYFRKLALKTFCTGLNNPYCEHLSHFQLDSLDEALQKCIALDNHKNQVSYMNFLKSQQKTEKPKTNNSFPTAFKSNFNARAPNNFSNNQFRPYAQNISNFSNQRNQFIPQNPNFHNNNSRPAFTSNNSNNYRNNFANNRTPYRSPMLRHQQINTPTPMSGVQSINTETRPMTISTQNFNVETDYYNEPHTQHNNVDEEFTDNSVSDEPSEYVEQNFHDLALDEHPPPL
ncbi:putative uncharacterized protein DDB_G0279653 [Diabrotica virgifera virgifera]|uniref:GATA zinc finger domain-containing protein 14-like n=1 Tax=Diabrotica virgifera virgifera TaxID=50390 RepID=A0ABM5L1E3_DIAVI|nr:putative uncharacterized protein DDB_G0279653 [Diabrotica virgifera virgifera]